MTYFTNQFRTRLGGGVGVSQAQQAMAAQDYEGADPDKTFDDVKGRDEAKASCTPTISPTRKSHHAGRKLPKKGKLPCAPLLKRAGEHAEAMPFFYLP